MRAQTVRVHVFLTGAAFVLLGAGLFVWKSLFVQLPLVPSQPEGSWQVEVQIDARGSDRELRIRAALPSSSDDQLIFGEQFSSGRLRLALLEDPDAGRRAVWRGNERGVFSVGAGFRVQMARRPHAMPVGRGEPPPEDLLRQWARPEVDFPSEEKAVVRVIEAADISVDDYGGWIRSLYSFVRHEIRSGDGDDAQIVLKTREGSNEGRERLLVTLLRAAGIPSRLARGLELSETAPRERVWAEAWLADSWWPLSASEGFIGELPRDFVNFGPAHEALVVASRAESLRYRFHAIRNRLGRRDIATLMTADGGWLAWLSLHRLPAGTQSALRVMLLLPFGTLILTILRNVVGMPSFGTFMPMLIALALRGAGLATGFMLLALVLTIAILGRLFITHLRLLLVPRLSVLLCVIVLTVSLLGLVGLEFDDRDFFAGILFPIVILTMLVERFSITLSEEGLNEALQRAAWSLVIAVIVYPIFRIESLELVFFSFPELILVVIGLLVWLGGYTGYRVSELIRFRQSVFEANP